MSQDIDLITEVLFYFCYQIDIPAHFIYSIIFFIFQVSNKHAEPIYHKSSQHPL